VPAALRLLLNPQELAARTNELPTDTWSRVFHEAAELGVMQSRLHGGERSLVRSFLLVQARGPLDFMST